MSAARGVQRERPVYDPVGVNRPLHILYVVQYFNLPSEPGGGRAYHFATHWARAGHRVTVVTGMVNTKTASIAEKCHPARSPFNAIASSNHPGH